MLKRIRRYLGRQKLIPWVGEFKETLAQSMFWVTPINFIMVAGTFYFTTLRYVLPWFELPVFVVFVVVGAIVILIIEFKFITPSIWAFRGKQMDLRNTATQVEGSIFINRRLHGRHNRCDARISRRRSNRKGYRRYQGSATGLQDTGGIPT